MRRSDLCDAIRRTLVRLPPPYDAHYGVVPPAPALGPVNLQTVARVHAEAMQAMRQADRIAATLPGHFALSRVLVRREAVTSSAIEGTHSTLDAVLSADETGEAADAATVQVRDYALALEQAIGRVRQDGRAALSLELICDLHRAVMTGDRDYHDRPGALRSGVVWIGGNRADISLSIFNPPPPSLLPDCLVDHVGYLGDDGLSLMQQSIIVRLAVAHAHFEAVHPFRDGNGRVGRLLLPLMMAADGHAPLYLAPHIALNRDGYVAGLKAAQQRLDHAPLIGFLSAAITESVREAAASMAAIDRVVEHWRECRSFRRGSAALRALDVLRGYPVVTARRLAAELGISFEAANRGIGQLVAAGVLVEITGQARNRLFAARDVLRVYNRPFGDPPPVAE